jgi:putative ABC transport system permease protein
VLQTGLYAGFLETSSSLIGRVGGDVWIMPRGTEVLDSVETLSASSRAIAEGHPCVARVRPVVFTWAFARKNGGARDTVRVVGTEVTRGGPIVPWELAAGLPEDLRDPMRVAVDAFDTKKLHLDANAIGARLEIGGQTTEVAAMSRGVRSFTLLPFVFADVATARRIAGMSDGDANYWVVDLADPGCADDVIARVSTHPELMAEREDDFRAKTQQYWLGGSGVGSMVGFSALLGLLVGLVVVGQTLYTMTKDHHRELATLKALGATSRELLGFVAWQAGLLAAAGGALGTALAVFMAKMSNDAGISIVLSPWVIATGAAAIVVMCALASGMSVRSVLKLRAAEVFQ